MSAQELYGVRTVGKNVTVGQGQTKSVTVVADAALPQGASIVWTSDDKEVATVEGNGTTATITGVDIGAVDVTATIVDANGRDLGYENATFNVEVLYTDTSEVTGNGTDTDQGKTSKITVEGGGFQLDTSSKKMALDQVHSVLAKNLPADQAGNITLAYDSVVLSEALASGNLENIF